MTVKEHDHAPGSLLFVHGHVPGDPLLVN